MNVKLSLGVYSGNIYDLSFEDAMTVASVLSGKRIKFVSDGVYRQCEDEFRVEPLPETILAAVTENKQDQ